MGTALEMPSYETPSLCNSSPGKLFYENSLGTANRQRALTLSPRPVLSLLHEDRPIISGEQLTMPSFSSSQRHPMNVRGLSSNYSNLVGASFSSENLGFGQASPGIIGRALPDSFNRPRTSSAVSLPAISNTAEE